ncbi:cupin domain-containing protein [Pseudomonas sp. NPDC007930]|uniref:AraC family transcriptional regulator n=1 Tax=Pseudomonas sp. NPDC007930 TaxID=3364417 RepID=UPI0036EBEEF9
MTDPLAEVVALLQPTACYTKHVFQAGRWRVSRSEVCEPFYCAVLEGRAWLRVSGQPPLLLEADDFVLVPAAYEFCMTSFEPPPEGENSLPVELGNATFRVGEQAGPAEGQALIGHCVFASPDAGLLVQLLPRVMRVRQEKRLATLVQLVRDEFQAGRPAREVVLARLLEVVFIEALRASAPSAAPGLIRGLADPRLAVALRHLHERPAERWTVAQLARAAALSRSAFFERFNREVGMAPMAYLLAWRMALAKQYLREQASNLGQIAQRLGYGSASAFSVAFSRQVGMPPARFAQAARGAAASPG